MLKSIRGKLIASLWQHYQNHSLQTQKLLKAFQQQAIFNYQLDHFAIIDLPSPHSGISCLSQLFSSIGYLTQGRDYLSDKQNDFLWMTEVDSFNQSAVAVLPQVVVADFRLDELPIEIKKVIKKYADQIPPSPLPEIQKQVGRAYLGEKEAADHILKYLSHDFFKRDWPLPTVKEFLTVKEANELLAWVLIFGRKPNHFGFSIHLLKEHFASLEKFLDFIEHTVHLPLTGKIKGGEKMGIAQGATQGETQTLLLADDKVTLSTDFLEFVWRYPKEAGATPGKWQDYFTGFIPQNADKVIESLYLSKK